MLPPEVLAQARAELDDWRGTGMSPLELPFTGREFKEIAGAARADLRTLLALPDGYRVLFLQGGALAHFALVPMNLLGRRRQADYVETGYWSQRAMREAARYCSVRVTASTAPTGFDRLPAPGEIRPSPDSAYCHITTNETANGVEYHWTPETAGVPLVADMTSNFLAAPVDVARYGLMYASAQKNVGPAGLTIVIVREDLLGAAAPETPVAFDYAAQADADSMINTPTTWAIYLAGLVFRWLIERGGLPAMAHAADRKSAILYAGIDGSDGFYRCPIVARDRSRTTVCFTLGEPGLTKPFLEEAERHGLRYLAGHPAAGGVRAALFNAMPEAGVQALVAFMGDFAQAHA
jgi:phosphoserine aminotransferase